MVPTTTTHNGIPTPDLSVNSGAAFRLASRGGHPDPGRSGHTGALQAQVLDMPLQLSWALMPATGGLGQGHMEQQCAWTSPTLTVSRRCKQPGYMTASLRCSRTVSQKGTVGTAGPSLSWCYCEEGSREPGGEALASCLSCDPKSLGATGSSIPVSLMGPHCGREMVAFNFVVPSAWWSSP